MEPNPFAHHVPGPVAQHNMDLFRASFASLWNLINCLPRSREKSLALTKLEEAGMFANKAAVLSDPDSKAE